MIRDELARRLIFAIFSRIKGGRLTLLEGGRRFHFGDPLAELAVEVEVRDPRAYAWTLRGSTGWGEGYVEGLWASEDLVGLARLACRNLPALDAWRRRFHFALGRAQRLASLVPRNTRHGARENISAHYDLGNDLFAAFLDETMMYSCALFPSPEATLHEAQLARLERICEQLDLGPDDHLVEIGTGWGAMAIHAAATRGCRVTTTTISSEQHALAGERVRQAGLSDRVEVLLSDYRDLTGTYSKLVSLEMIEAVGWQYFPTYFAKCSSLLAGDGAMFLQAIVIDDDAYELEKASRSFANKHIFPGGCLPSERLIGELLAGETDMRTTRLDDITEHYPPTLAAWRERFNAAWPQLRGDAYDERFRRLWNIYLALSEGGFRERRIRDLQFLIAKPGFRPRAGEPADARSEPSARRPFARPRGRARRAGEPATGRGRG